MSPSQAVEWLAPETTAPDFWKRRPELEHIHAYAHARMCSPSAVLGVILARIACTVPPNVVLPPIVGSDASLNLFVGLVGPSGSGKSAAMAAGNAAVRTAGFPTIPLGSGEGISRSYAYRHRKTREMIWVERSVLFTATEVDALAAVGGRQGATLGPQLREMFNGAELGFGYADPEKKIILASHSYRASVLVGLQPGRAGYLLDDQDGGTPQRFLFMPATDPTIPRYPEPIGSQWIPPDLTWPKPRAPFPLPNGDDDSEPEGRGLGPREELWVNPSIIDAIQSAAHIRATGIGEALDGHALLVRLKTAAALAILAGRKMVQAEDWDLSGSVMAISDQTRTQMQQELMAARTAVSERLGHAEGIRQATAEQIKGVREEQRVTELVLAKMKRQPAPGVDWRRSTLRKALPARDRDTFDRIFESILSGSRDEVVAHALADGDIYLPDQGDKWTDLSTSPRASQERA